MICSPAPQWTFFSNNMGTGSMIHFHIILFISSVRGIYRAFQQGLCFLIDVLMDVVTNFSCFWNISSRRFKIYYNVYDFNLKSYKNNYRIWASENLTLIIQKPSHSTRITICCAFWSGGVIVSYLFWKLGWIRCYCQYYSIGTCWHTFFWPIIDDMDVSDMWFH